MNKVGEIVRVEWDQETGQVRVLFEIFDANLKRTILQDKDIKDIITIVGKDVMIIASKSKNEK
jgi:hypothetical protein